MQKPSGNYLDTHRTVTAEFLDRFASAWNRHDVDAILSMMTSDCTMLLSAGADPDCCAAVPQGVSLGTVHGPRGGLIVTTYNEPDSRIWSPVSVRGTAMEGCPVFEGHGMRSGVFRMSAGCQLPDHHHAIWVQVAVLSGRMRVEQAGNPARIVPAGGVYFVNPGEDHVETAEVETILLVTKGEDRKQA